MRRLTNSSSREQMLVRAGRSFLHRFSFLSFLIIIIFFVSSLAILRSQALGSVVPLPFP